MAARTKIKKKILAKQFAHAISVHYRDFDHAYVYWIWLRGSASYVVIMDEAFTYNPINAEFHVFYHEQSAEILKLTGLLNPKKLYRRWCTKAKSANLKREKS